MTRILVVDDETADPSSPGHQPARPRVRGRLAATGEEALVDVARDLPDLVLLDLGLPGIDGVDVIRGLRGWTSVPIIVLSAREGDPSKVEALDAGADDYVTKPFSINELLARVRASLRRHQPSARRSPSSRQRFHRRSGRPTSHSGRRVRAPHADGVGDRRESSYAIPDGWSPSASCCRRVGAAVRARDQLPAGPPRGDPPQARARPRPAALLHHRPGIGYRFEPS